MCECVCASDSLHLRVCESTCDLEVRGDPEARACGETGMRLRDRGRPLEDRSSTGLLSTFTFTFRSSTLKSWHMHEHIHTHSHTYLMSTLFSAFYPTNQPFLTKTHFWKKKKIRQILREKGFWILSGKTQNTHSQATVHSTTCTLLCCFKSQLITMKLQLRMLSHCTLKVINMTRGVCTVLPEHTLQQHTLCLSDRQTMYWYVAVTNNHSNQFNRVNGVKCMCMCDRACSVFLWLWMPSDLAAGLWV